MKKGLCRTLLGEVYWYANISGRNTYLGRGEQGPKSNP
jgi:hypothetical protein